MAAIPPTILVNTCESQAQNPVTRFNVYNNL